MARNVVIIIRNAMQYDFGGGERVPVFIGRVVLKHSNLKPIIFSRSHKLLEFAHANGVPYRQTWWWSRQNWSGIRVALVPVYFTWQLFLFLYYLFLFAHYRPATVHIQSKDDFIAATYAARLIRARIIWSDHADLKHIFRNHRTWYKNPIGKAVYLAARLAEEIIVVSKEDRHLIARNISKGVVYKKMRVVYNGAFDSYKSLKKYRSFTFVSTGRLVTDKGIGELIETFNEFHQEYGNSRLYLLGDGPERKKFEKMAEKNKSIRFLGYQQEPLDYVAKSHAFVLPTYHEGFSLALVEACMLELPIIATDVGGNPEIIRDMETGLLIKTRDTVSLYGAMVKIYNDKELRNRLSRSARKKYVESFDFEQIIRREFISFYEGKR